jgi:multidrug efflux system membrane fusion protein
MSSPYPPQHVALDGVVMNRCRIRLALVLSAMLFVTGCEREQNAFVEPPPPPVTVATPFRRVVTNALEYTGTTAALDFVNIQSRISGYLQSVNFRDRQLVKKDDVLFVIDPAPYQVGVEKAEAGLAVQKASLKLAETEIAKYQLAYNQGVVSNIELAQSIAKRDTAQAQVLSAQATLDEAKLELGYTSIKAPMAGQVGKNQLSVGNLIGAGDGQVLTTLIDASSVYVNFSPSESDLLAVRKSAGNKPSDGKVPRMPVFVSLSDESNFPHKGIIDYYGTQVDARTGTIPVRAIVPNPDGVIFPGMFVRVRVPLGSQEALLVPDVAVGQDQGGTFLLTVNGQGVVERKSVTLGILVEQLRVIASGITESDRVIISGIQRAQPGGKVAATEGVIDDAGLPIPPAATSAPTTAP